MVNKFHQLALTTVSNYIAAYLHSIKVLFSVDVTAKLVRVYLMGRPH